MPLLEEHVGGALSTRLSFPTRFEEFRYQYAVVAMKRYLYLPLQIQIPSTALNSCAKTPFFMNDHGLGL